MFLAVVVMPFAVVVMPFVVVVMPFVVVLMPFVVVLMQMCLAVVGHNIFQSHLNGYPMTCCKVNRIRAGENVIVELPS